MSGEILTIDDKTSKVTDIHEAVITEAEEMVELVGGPCDGTFVAQAKLPDINYRYGIAVYRDEGFGKARYVKD